MLKLFSCCFGGKESKRHGTQAVPEPQVLFSSPSKIRSSHRLSSTDLHHKSFTKAVSFQDLQKEIKEASQELVKALEATTPSDEPRQPEIVTKTTVIEGPKIEPTAQILTTRSLADTNPPQNTKESEIETSSTSLKSAQSEGAIGQSESPAELEVDQQQASIGTIKDEARSGERRERKHRSKKHRKSRKRESEKVKKQEEVIDVEPISDVDSEASSHHRSISSVPSSGEASRKPSRTSVYSESKPPIKSNRQRESRRVATLGAVSSHKTSRELSKLPPKKPPIWF